MTKDIIVKEIKEQIKVIDDTIKSQFAHYSDLITNFINNLFEEFVPNQNPIKIPRDNKKIKGQKTLSSEFKIIHLDKDYRNIFNICFLKDGRLVSGSKMGKISIYNRKSYKKDFYINDGSNDVFSVCGLRNGNLASGGSDKLMKIWEIDGNKYKNIYTLNGHNYSINKIIELEDGKLCSCSPDATIRIWDNKKSYQCIQTLEHKSSGRCIIEINNYIISATDEHCKNVCLKIWDKSIYECIKIVDGASCRDSNSLSKLKENAIILGSWNKLFILDILSFQYKSLKNKQFGIIGSICVLKDENVLLGNDYGEIIYFNLLANQIFFIQKLYDVKVSCIIETEDKIFSGSKER